MSELFVGQHRPLIPKRLFDDVQAVLSGKSVKKKIRHLFLFRRLIRCGRCNNLFVGERQKGHVYYRCHTRKCPQQPLKEELINEYLCHVLKRIRFSDDEVQYLESEINKLSEDEPKRVEKRKQELVLKGQLISSRLEKLADAYMDGVFDRETYASKKNSLIRERAEIIEGIAALEGNSEKIALQLKEFLELAKTAYSSYNSANYEERRDLVEIVVSNFIASGNTLLIKLNSPFAKIAERHRGPDGCPFRDTFRTVSALLSDLLKYREEIQRIRVSPGPH